MAAVHAVYISNDQNIYVAADNGVYVSAGQNGTWQKIFTSSNSGNTAVYTVWAEHNTVIIGTNRGLFLSRNGKTWNKVLAGDFQNERIGQLLQFGSSLYISAAGTIYRLSDNFTTSERIFITGHSGPGSRDESLSDEIADEQEITTSGITAFDVLDNVIAVSTMNGLAISQTPGRDWENLYSDNLPLEAVKAIKILDANKENLTIFLATQKGGFLFKDGRWMPVYKGMTAARFWDAAVTADGDLYAEIISGHIRGIRQYWTLKRNPLRVFPETFHIMI